MSAFAQTDPAMEADIRPLPQFVPFSPPSIGDEEIREVVDTLQTGWLTTGPKTERFEAAIRDYTGAKHAVAVNSCTAALHLALHVLGIGEGDGVITSPYTFASTGHVILYERARPFLVDVEPDTFNIDPALIEKFINEECEQGPEGKPVHKDTGITIKCLLPIHYGGHSCRMDELSAIAQKYNLFIVEDAAHALGSEYKGSRIGSVGDITCFSFYATKNVATGEGGMAVTNDEALAARMRVLSMYGISDARRIWKRYAPKGSWVYDVKELGFKYNMMDIQAALGLHQLGKLDAFIDRRNENAAVYDDIFSGMEEVSTPVVREYTRHARHLYHLLLDPEKAAMTRDDFIEVLKEYNIGTSVLFIPLHLHSLYQSVLPYREGDFPVSEDIFRRIINLPVSPALPAQTARRIGEILAGLIRKKS